mgnify:CR=1 FL=1
MRAIDTNVLIFGVMSSSAHHTRSRELLDELAGGSLPWGIPWPCLYEFLRVVTHPRVFHPPMPVEEALGDLTRILESPSVVLLSETPRHAQVMEEVIRQSGVRGNLIHDAHVAALCLEHGASELITGDRDFLRFAGLRVSNPFAGRP